MSKEKPPFRKDFEKERCLLQYASLRLYLFVVFQDRIASVMLAQE